MKKLLALLLALAMVLSMVACGAKTEAPETTAPAGNESTGETQTTESETPATYTQKSAWSVFPASWNPHTYEEEISGDMLGYIEDGFWTFDYNEDLTGFEMVPAMCVDDHPVDITSEYVGKYGIEEGAEGLVYKINLRDDLAWDDGTKITANDFVESAKRLLNPAAKNYRADSFYTGDVVVYNAEAYLKQGQVSPASVGTIMGDEGLADLDAFFAAHGEDIAYINWNYSFGAQYDFDTTPWTEGTPDAAGFSLTPEDAVVATPLTMNQMREFFVSAAMALNGADEATAISWIYDELYVEKTFPAVDFSEVGIFALSDTELVYVLTAPMKGFYLKYGLPATLVHLETYDACLAIDENGIYSSTYGTSVETTKSYGPYKLVEFQSDKFIKFEKNTAWYGHTADTYQTTHIEIQQVGEASTRLEMFLAGQLDSYGLSADDFATYGLSDYRYDQTSPSTFAMAFNPNVDALKTQQEKSGANINKTIISLIEFRQAMCFGMDRAAFTAATDPAGVVAFGLFSSQHIVDPETGIGYRNTPEGDQVLVDFWGLSDDVGEGKLYADNAEAVDGLTGYNPEQAKALFDAAYDKALAEGLMDEDDVVEICIGMPRADSVFYNNGYNFIVNNYTELVKGTKLEGKLTFTRNDTLGQNYATALKNNEVEMLFGVGWSGMAMNPYGLIMAYMTQQYQYDSHTDYTTIDLTVELGGVEYTTTVHNWYEIINGAAHTLTAADGSTIDFVCGAMDENPTDRLTILAAIEGAVLLNYNFIPLNGDASALLKSMKVEYYSEDYNMMMGFGGLKYNTYNYTDAEWDEFVASQGGELDYT